MTDRDPCPAADPQLLRSGLDDDALEFAVAGFAALWRGHPIDPTLLLPDRADDATRAAAALAARGRAELDPGGLLVGVHGLTLRDSRHSFVHHGVARHTWCAFDSVGIPAALGLDAVARTDCPACGRALTVDVRDGSVRAASPVLWFPEPDDSSHLMESFCAVADLYCSPAHLEQTIEVDQTPGSVVRLAEAAALGRDVWADITAVDLESVDRSEGVLRDRHV